MQAFLAGRCSAIIADVSLQVAERQTEGYRILTDVYEGPLDLLLQLIERAELDITRLALAQVTDQYLDHLRALQDRSAAEVSAFLVIAARLVQIKSAALLPRQPVESSDEPEEDLGEALARQLILYKRFKELGHFLEDRDARGLHTHLRIAPPPKIAYQPKLDLTGITLADLLQSARDVFANENRLPELSQVVTMPRVTIREKISSIVSSLRRIRTVSFRGLLSQRTNRLEVVVTFLAMLELVKQHIVAAHQDALFGDIEIQTIGELVDEEEIKVEFEE